MFGLFRRFRRRLGAHLDGMIAQIENHEALVESAVRELEASLARAEREHAHAVTANGRLRQGLAEEREATVSWRERALREGFEARGIECLRRSKRAERHARELAERLAEHEAVEARLSSRAALLGQKLAEFREQEALLRLRQSRTQSAGSPGAPAATSALDVALLLERWEAQLSENELANGSLPFSIEDLSDEPRDAAEEAALALELREMKEKTR